MQHSDEDQMRVVVEHAAQHRLYVVPEYTCVDRADVDCRTRREGLDRARCILRSRLASVLLVHSLCRLFRCSFDAIRFIQGEVVEARLRAIAVAQGIDTADNRSWNPKSQVLSIMDETLIEAISKHCREGLRYLFLRGYTPRSQLAWDTDQTNSSRGTN